MLHAMTPPTIARALRRRLRLWGVASVIALAVLGCGRGAHDEPAGAAAPLASVGELLPPPTTAPRSLVAIHISFSGPARRGEEAARTAFLLEHALRGLPDTVAFTTGALPAPGAELALRDGARTLTVAARLDGEALAARFCDAAGECIDVVESAATAEARAAAVAGRLAAWARLGALAPVADSLLPGRFAWGWLRARDVPRARGAPSLSDTVRGHPGAGEVWGLLGRFAAAEGRWSEAGTAFSMEWSQTGQGAALADAAVAWMERGQGDRLLSLVARDPALARDPRLALLVAMAPCARGPLDTKCLSDLPPPFGGRPQVLARLAEAVPAEEEARRVEAFLRAARQSGDPGDAERAREIALLAGRYADAQAMDELAVAEGGTPAGRELRLAMAVAAGRWDEAAAEARTAGTRHEIAWRAARSRGEEVPVARGESLDLAVARARRALDSGQTRAALHAAEGLLRREPWQPDAWAIKTRALAELGRMAEASEALVGLLQVDPLCIDAAVVRRLIRGG